MRHMSFMHFFMDSKTSFSVEALKQSGFSFQSPELRGEPGSRLSERDRTSFNWSKGV